MGCQRGLTPASDAGTRGLHVCPECGAKLVQPTDWWEVGSGSWHVELHCPNCEWRGGGAYSQSEVDRFDRELDDGCDDLIADLRALTRTNMEEEAQRFILALASDSLLPEDF
jgi:hypothetical protein